MEETPRHKIPDVMLDRIYKLFGVFNMSCKIISDKKTEEHHRHELMAWYNGLTFSIIRNYKKYQPRAHVIKVYTTDGEIVFDKYSIGDDGFIADVNFAITQANDYNRTKIEL